MPSRRFGARPGIGRRAEDLAVALLERGGLRVVERNWRRPEGELDIVADAAGTCGFVGVRSRTAQEMGHPLESITPRKRAQIVRAARLFLNERPTSALAYRFDVVSVVFANDGDGEPQIVHIPAAFEAT